MTAPREQQQPAPADGEPVTVRAVWPMPGAAAGAVVTVRWGPHLAVLVEAGRYELLPEPTAAQPNQAERADDRTAGDAPAAGDTSDGAVDDAVASPRRKAR